MRAVRPFVTLLLLLLVLWPLCARSGTEHSVPEWATRGGMQALKDPDQEVHMWAVLRPNMKIWHTAAALSEEDQRVAAARMVRLFESQYDFVRAGAAKVAGVLGRAMKEHSSELAALLRDEDDDVRRAAADAIGRLDLVASEVARQLNKIRGVDAKRKARTREELISRLLTDPAFNFGTLAWADPTMLAEEGERLTAQIAERLNAPQREVRKAAVVLLWKIAEQLEKAMPTKFLGWNLHEEYGDFTEYFRSGGKTPVEARSASEQLASIGRAMELHAVQLVELLEESDPIVRLASVALLGLIGDPAESYAPRVAHLVADPDDAVKKEAIRALRRLRPRKDEALGRLVGATDIHELDEASQEAAIRALMDLGQRADEYAPQLARLLKSRHQEVRKVSLWLLGFMGPPARGYARQVVALLNDRYDDVRSQVRSALLAMGPLDMGGILAILNEIYRDASRTGELRFLAHLLAGGERETETLVQWLGRPVKRPFDRLNHENGVYTLDVFERVWPLSEPLAEVRNDLRAQIAEVIQAVRWNYDDLPRLKRHASNLAGTPEEAALLNVIASIERTRWTVNTGKIWLGHALFWMILIFVYPKSPQIQAIFFWNPWVRRLVGLGYVGFALTWIPYLRSKLFAPFREPLLADAALESFDPQAYFQESEVTGIPPGVARPITETIPAIRGQLVLEGESGLGKTMFLRHLVKSSQRIVVYLPAKKCAHGVVEAIQEKLHGPARDPAFLRTLIYIGAIDVCIDGLNEVDADTRARISDFAESNFRGNILMATQPLGWTPPSTAKVYILQPLAREQIERFLLTRTQSLPADASVTGKDYEGACLQYLECTLNPEQPDETLATVKRVLSNPMDLTVVAEMLARGQQPDLFHLQQQQYHIMAADYKRTNIDQDFPLGLFSERVYQMRLVGQVALPAEEFLKELQAMERHKMVLSRQYEDPHGSPRKEWYFRHDKVMDFFLVQTFLGADNQRPQKHLGDPRFRGVYFLLAMLLPLEAAQTLREHLIHYAADTKDHTVSHAFIQLLRTRKAA